MTNTRAIIIDGYVDEPACFGVPPYISPYIRYVAGALREQGLSENDIHYTTIDSIRSGNDNKNQIIKSAHIVIIVAGMTVPGKYLRSTPISPGEIESIFSANQGIKILGGPIRLGFSKEGGKTATSLEINYDNTFLAQSDIEALVYDIFKEGLAKIDSQKITHRFRTVEEIGRWSKHGAFIIKKHPDYPQVMCEMETYRGCGRKKHCSFCTEPSYGQSDYRPINDVIEEVQELYNNGARYFRIGRQPDIISYHATDKGGDMPKPNPEALKKLYKGIRAVAPELRVLHMDNANPATISEYPELSKDILKTIVKYHTSGDIAALGMESADPMVIRSNNLKVMPEQIFEVIKLINEIGSSRGSNGMPELLPGINFVHGLKGETKNTFDYNYNFLKEVLDAELLLRRINIRQVMAFPNTDMYGNDELVQKHKKLFLKYKENVRKDIDLPMLRKVVPTGTILKDVFCEVNDKNICFGRQFGSYPLLAGIPANMPLNHFIDIVVTGHGHRSITGIPYPLKINTAPITLIKELPGIGKKQATKIYSKTPFSNESEFLKYADNQKELLKYISI
jgi:radical SAM superfamily enzyme with C-terminal helix-hairpin-helix motif